MNCDNKAGITALIADDEPLLRVSLRQELQSVWPELEVVSEVSNGHEALLCLQNRGVDVAFLDIKMPGKTGLEVARQLVESWHKPATDQTAVTQPLLVMVTAYSEFALEAFEGAAVDYVLKPVTHERLSKTVSRLKARLQERKGSPDKLEKSALQTLARQLTQLAEEEPIMHAPRQSSHLKLIRAGVGDTVRMIPVDEVVLFEAADKYVVVHTPQGESLIRESLRDLSSQLDPSQFQQIHRSSIVNMKTVKAALRNENGKLVLNLNGVCKQPVVSRHYAHLFKAM